MKDSDHEQRKLDQKSGEELDRRAGHSKLVYDKATRTIETMAPSYSELVRALAFLLTLFDQPWDMLLPSQQAQLESARKLLLRAQAAQ